MPRTSAAVTRATPSDPRAPEAGPRTPAAAPGPPTPTSRVGAGRGGGPAAPVTADEGLALSAEVVERLREVVPRVADETVSTITREVPSYARPFSEAMGERIRAAVEVALLNFLDLARSGSGSDPAEPIAPSTTAAYELGRGEARSGRSLDALQTAYRIGARMAWRGLSREALVVDVPAATLGAFADLIFAYIDALSSASIAGHADELASAGRARERYRERLAEQLVAGAKEADLAAAARRAEWIPPRTLVAVVLPEGQVQAVLGLLDARTLHVALPRVDEQEEAPDGEGWGVLLVPDTTARDRERLMRQLEGRSAVVGPERPWTEAHRSFARVARARTVLPRARLGPALDTEEHLTELLLGADPEALADLRARVLAPLAEVRPSSRARLEETLRSWLLHHGRRELIAAHLFVHPQTVRYRMGQLRELFGDRLDDPEEVLRLTVALAAPEVAG